MGLMGPTGKAGTTGVDRGNWSVHGLNEAEAFLMVQAGINAYVLVGFTSTIHQPTSYEGSNFALGYTYRGQAYVSDPSVGLYRISNYFYGDLYTCLATARDLSTLGGGNNTSILNMNTGWAPFDSRKGAQSADNPRFIAFRYQAVAPSTHEFYRVAYKPVLDTTTHMLKLPVYGNPMGPANISNLYWATFSTETETIISIVKQ